MNFSESTYKYIVYKDFRSLWPDDLEKFSPSLVLSEWIIQLDSPDKWPVMKRFDEFFVAGKLLNK